MPIQTTLALPCRRHNTARHLTTPTAGVECESDRILHVEQYLEVLADPPAQGGHLRFDWGVADVLDKGQSASVLLNGRLAR